MKKEKEKDTVLAIKKVDSVVAGIAGYLNSTGYWTVAALIWCSSFRILNVTCDIIAFWDKKLLNSYRLFINFQLDIKI